MRSVYLEFLIRRALVKWASDLPLWTKIKPFLLHTNLFTDVYEGCMIWMVHKSAMDNVCPCPDCVLQWVNEHYFVLFSLLCDYIKVNDYVRLAEAYDLYISNDMLYGLAELQHSVPQGWVMRNRSEFE